jgi:diguanylate cyclase (GGDEF)-like protein
LAGDKVLKIFANSIRDLCREYDYTARMGGDEFLIVAPNITAEAVREKAALLNAMATRASRAVCGKDILSVSLGVAFYPQDGLDAEQLLSEADRSMYKAKQSHYGSLGSPSSKNARSFNFYDELVPLERVN